MPVFVARMKEHFAGVETAEIPAARGEPDVIVVGRAPRGPGPGPRITEGASAADTCRRHLAATIDNDQTAEIAETKVRPAA